MEKRDIQNRMRYRARVPIVGVGFRTCDVEVICRAKHGGGWKARNLSWGGRCQIALASQFIPCTYEGSQA